LDVQSWKEREVAPVVYLDYINFDADGFDDVKTSKEAEDIIRQHVNDPEFYSNSEGEFLEFHRVPKSDYETVSRLLKELGFKDST